MQNLHNIAQQIKTLLNNASVTFASITTETKVVTAAKFKHLDITKRTVANVQLFCNINAFTSVYTNAVKRNAAKIGDNNAANVEDFTAQSNYYTHSEDCYSIVAHKEDANKLYLYAIYNSVQSSEYFIGGVAATKQQVAAYLTASAAAKLLDTNNVTHNKTQDVLHTVVVRAIALNNVKSITANKQTVVF